MNIGVSACLLGCCCKYNGGHNMDERVCSLQKEHTLIPVCPEMMGGMSCPRIPCEIQDGKVIDRNGVDQSVHFVTGAKKALDVLKENNVDLVILQPRSPSCGLHQIYDGTFSSTLKEGKGVFASLLEENQIPVLEANSAFSCH